MKVEIFSQVCPFFISVFDATEWHFPLHRHTHYELIFIFSGTGVHHLNEGHVAYQSNDLFLCTPRDAHRFTIEQPTRFCIVKMNLGFLLMANETFPLVQPLFEAQEAHSPFLFDVETKAYLRNQLEFCVREFRQRQFLYTNTIQASLLNVLVLLGRERLRQQGLPSKKTANADTLVTAMIHHIHGHIREPEQLTAAVIAARFHFSLAYIGQYFRRHTGQSLKNFIQRSRVRAIQLQLEFSDKTVCQLAIEYGYTDESHLAKTFRLITAETPIGYRNRVHVPATT